MREKKGSLTVVSNPFRGEYFGAIRFASAETVHGQIYYTISEKDVLSWVPGLPFKRSAFHVNELQANARLALIHLAEGRVNIFWTLSCSRVDVLDAEKDG